MDPTTPACFNCEKTDGVEPFSFDLDLPTLAGCPMCRMALALGDDETLKALQPRRKTKGRAR